MERKGVAAAFGADLRRAREERGMAVETVSGTTKVPVRHIRALEAGELGELPGGVFRRGFARSYLGALGLDEGVWMRRFEENCRQSGLDGAGQAEWAKFAENVKNSRVVPRRGIGIRWIGAGILMVALGLGGWCGWRLASHRGLLSTAPIFTVLKSSVDNAPSR